MRSPSQTERNTRSTPMSLSSCNCSTLAGATIVISISLGFLPVRSHSSAIRCLTLRTSSALERMRCMPAPNRTARRTAASEIPPITNGIDCDSGCGVQYMFSKLTNSPLNVAGDCDQSAVIASRYSSARAPRRANGTPTASNSSESHPRPKPRMMRPLESRSKVAICLASTTGLRMGRITTPVASLILLVDAAR
ncbi:unannotated protein [freshwater metagenome]|uniref:Unannotated protein n=1 Tax=freshwater metagenome TaxID=449393 RepID=A0A6J7GZY1_9ZZZZ